MLRYANIVRMNVEKKTMKCAVLKSHKEVDLDRYSQNNAIVYQHSKINTNIHRDVLWDDDWYRDLDNDSIIHPLIINIFTWSFMYVVQGVDLITRKFK